MNVKGIEMMVCFQTHWRWETQHLIGWWWSPLYDWLIWGCQDPADPASDWLIVVQALSLADLRVPKVADSKVGWQIAFSWPVLAKIVSVHLSDKQSSVWTHISELIIARRLIQGTVKRLRPGLENFITAVAYHFCLSTPESFTQPGRSLLAEPCTL